MTAEVGEDPRGAQEDVALDEDIFIADGEFVDGEDDDIEFVDAGEGLDAETIHFDQVVGVLSDFLIDPSFEELRESFCRENCKHFEDTVENKLIYMDMFQRYTALVEAAIDARLSAVFASFEMRAFLQDLAGRKDQLMSDVFDLLMSIGDFEEFREMMLSYKREMAAAGPGLSIQVRPLQLHTEEQEDGEARPDLDLSLTISPVGVPKAHTAVA